MQFAIIQWLRIPDARRNFTCDRCATRISYKAIQTGGVHTTLLKVGEQFDVIDYSWHRFPLKVTLCEGCSEFFAEYHRLSRLYDAYHTCALAINGLSRTDLEQADWKTLARIVLGRAGSKAGEYDRLVGGEIQAWWPALVEMIARHEAPDTGASPEVERI